MCSVLLLIITLNIGCIISLFIQNIKTVGIVTIIFFCIAVIMEIADLTRFIKRSEINFRKWRCFSLCMFIFYVSFCVFAVLYKYSVIVGFTVIPAFFHFIHLFFWRKRIRNIYK